MKLLTLNTHSLLEKQSEEKLQMFAEFLCRQQPDVIALQEVNQTCTAAPLPSSKACAGKGLLKEDNYAYRLHHLLEEKGMYYEWRYLPMKIGYERFDEGLAIFSKYPIQETESIQLSSCGDPANWKTRYALGVRWNTEKGSCWLYDVHMGWWNDEEEPFRAHWETLQTHLKEKEGRIYLAGDFNACDDVCEEGYDLVMKDGWFDTYLLAEEKDDGKSTSASIDGWKKQGSSSKKIRIDYIFCNEKITVAKHTVMCNGITDPIVSDHFAVCMEESI